MKTLPLKLSLFAVLAALPGIASAAPIALTGTTACTQNFDALTSGTITGENSGS